VILISERYIGQLTAQSRFMNKTDYADKSKRLKGHIKCLDKSIADIDSKIEKLIASDNILSNQHKLLCSIDGIGTVIATNMIIETNAFQDFDGRSFCCYAGVAPFEYTSGSSIISRRRVSHKAHKKFKSLLHLAAISVAAAKKDGELHEYYLRKIAEGKNKMSVLNAIRGKLILRMFVVIKENRPYQKEYKVKRV
jgi:transposase